MCIAHAHLRWQCGAHKESPRLGTERGHNGEQHEVIYPKRIDTVVARQSNADYDVQDSTETLKYFECNIVRYKFRVYKYIFYSVYSSRLLWI